jgi:uncharacterized membrane protein YfcA
MKAFIISLLIAILSGMGVGGGGLLVIYLTLFEGIEQIVAQGSNLCFFIMVAVASSIYNIKKKKIVWKTTLVLSVSGTIFSLLGGYLAGLIDPSVLRKIFGAMLIFGGISSLITAFSQKKQIQNI